MTPHVEDELLPYALGITPAGPKENIEVHLQECSACMEVLAECRDEVALLAIGLDTVVAPALLREELLHALGEINRFSDATDTIAKKLQLNRTEVESMLDSLDQMGTWNRATAPHTWVYAVEGVKRAAFMRVPPGCDILALDDCGPTALVLQGRCRDDSGQVFSVGDSLEFGGDEPRNLVVQGGPDFICLCYEPRSRKAVSPQTAAQKLSPAARQFQAVPTPK